MPDTEESALLTIAHDATREAAKELLSRFGKRARGVRTKSSPTDLVSDADVAAESAIRYVLGEHRPGDAILGEEGGATGPRDGERRWLIDPLDGTVNYLFGIPSFAVSVACEDATGTLAGVVLDPLRDECFAASRSTPATLNGEPIHSYEAVEELGLAMVATGFAYEASLRARQAAVVARVLPRVRDIRRVGAAALDLCWSACGRYDAYYERGLHPWDLGAGALIATRAGLAVRELAANDDDPAGIVVAPRELIDELFTLVDSTDGGSI